MTNRPPVRETSASPVSDDDYDAFPKAGPLDPNLPPPVPDYQVPGCVANGKNGTEINRRQLVDATCRYQLKPIPAAETAGNNSVTGGNSSRRVVFALLAFAVQRAGGARPSRMRMSNWSGPMMWRAEIPPRRASGSLQRSPVPARPEGDGLAVLCHHRLSEAPSKRLQGEDQSIEREIEAARHARASCSSGCDWSLSLLQFVHRRRERFRRSNRR